jgi:radical SAM protein with 4Fe4S-binding SPASM domain
MRLCSFIKEPCADIRKDAFPESFMRLYAYFQGLKASVPTKCLECKIQYLCRQCPGRALAENGDMEQPVKFFCALAHRQEEAKGRFLN